MGRAIPTPWFRDRRDYDAVRALINDEPTLFDTFDQWLDEADKRILKFSAKGLPVKKVIVDPEAFVTFCRSGAIASNRSSLISFIATESAKPSDAGT